MAFDAKTQRLLALKKLSGKAHTSNDKGLANEGVPSGISMSKSSIFSSDIPVSPSASSLYTITGNAVEFLRLSASFIAGTDTLSGRHGFELKLPDDYEAQSSNPRKGTYPYLNGQSIQITSGSLQLVPPSFASSYEGKVFHTGSGETRVYLLDSRDWNLDYFNGVYFQQDPPGVDDHVQNPRYIDAYLYIGDYLTGTIGSGGGGDTDGWIDLNRVRKNYTITSDLDPTLTFNAAGTNFGAGKYSVNTIDVWVNGQLLNSGTQAQVNAGAVDYTITGAGSLSFTFGLVPGDVVSTAVLQTGSSTLAGSSDYYLVHSDSTLVNARTLTAGPGIDLDTSQTGKLVVSTLRQKEQYKVTGSHSALSPLTIPNINFQSGSYHPRASDIFVNGQMMASGSSEDYILEGTTTGLIFRFDLVAGDIVTAIVA